MKVLNSLKLQINLQTGWTFSLRYKSAYLYFFSRWAMSLWSCLSPSIAETSLLARARSSLQ